MKSPSIALVARLPDAPPFRIRATLTALLLGTALALAQAMPALSSAPDSFADLADKVSPSVVNITTSTAVATAAEPNPIVPEGSPFEDFFRDFMDRNGPGGRAPRRSSALGSGFVISEDGYIVTNNHVIEGADEIEIEFFPTPGLPSEPLKATVVGTDPTTDIALLKVDSPTPLPYVSFGNSDVVRVGDWVMAMGNPLGQGFSVSAGIVSARNRTLQGSYDDFIQTDAAINRGNSGGPLFNLNGEVVGVNTAILSPNGGSIGIGFAMSSAVVQNVVAQLREFGETRRGWLGVRIQDVTPELAEAIGLPSASGALVTDVPEGPALAAGIQQGDVILSFDGTEVQDTRGLVRKVGNTEVGKAVRVVVFRNGNRETLLITLGRREEAERVVPAGQPSDPAPVERDLLGMTVVPLTDEIRQGLGLPASTSGLVVRSVQDGSEAAAKGMQEGDVIAEAGQVPVATVDDLEEQVEAVREAGRKSLLLLVRRGGEPRFVALTIE